MFLKSHLLDKLSRALKLCISYPWYYGYVYYPERCKCTQVSHLLTASIICSSHLSNPLLGGSCNYSSREFGQCQTGSLYAEDLSGNIPIMLNV